MRNGLEWVRRLATGIRICGSRAGAINPVQPAAFDGGHPLSKDSFLHSYPWCITELESPQPQES